MISIFILFVVTVPGDDAPSSLITPAAQQTKLKGQSYRYYLCGPQRRSRVLGVERPCTGDLYPIHETERAALAALEKVLTCPESVAEALAVHREGRVALKLTPDEVRRRLREMDAAPIQMKGEEQSTVQAQLAGIRAGASPEAYAAVFADIASRRKGLEGKRGVFSSPPRRPEAGKTGEGEIMAGMLKAALAVLSDPDVPGSEKRSALAPIVERVICQKGGADVVFAPGLFDESWGKGGDAQTYQTTCIGISTQR